MTSIRLKHAMTIEIEVEIVFHYTPPVRAKGLSGPPEFAQPPEPAVVEIEEIILGGCGTKKLDLRDCLYVSEGGRIASELLEVAPDLCEQYAPGEES